MRDYSLSIIGRRVRYSITRDESAIGIIADKIDMRNDKNDQGTVTGYLIENEETGELSQIQHWRLLQMLPGESTPLKAIPGGYNADTRSALQL